jgi:hypothetical protein
MSKQALPFVYRFPDPELKKKVEDRAKETDRSINSHITYLLKKDLEESQEEKEK